MSYILDALNKSEQQKERQQPPRLTSVHHKPDRQGASPWRWLWALASLALLNTALFWYWTTGTPDQPSDPPPEASTVSTDIEPLVARTPPSPPVPFEGEIVTPADIDNPAVRPATLPVRIAELPAVIQRQIPELAFSSHIYSDDPSLRMVNINGRNFREGASLGDDLTLIEITEEGVVLQYLHYSFEMSVIRDWSFD